MMVALVLSCNMRNMVKNNVMVRKMVGIETSGRIDTLLTDKTGTITKGHMEVSGIVLGSGVVISDYNELMMYHGISNYILMNMSLNNEAKINDDGEVIGGNMTDKALLNFSHKYKYPCKILDKELFDSSKKYSSIKVKDRIEHQLFKGASEVLLPKVKYYYDNNCKKVISDNTYIKSVVDKYSKMGYRVLMMADGDGEELIFLCIVLLKDEINDNAKEAVEMISHAGVHIIMVTGDAKDTAINIGREVGLIKNNEGVLTSEEISRMSDEEISDIYDQINIIARAKPNDKSRLVRIGESIGKVVGMSGDGVNDAPALKVADVGFAMGSGAEVSREASDIVILDNNLLSIGNAILYGRTIFKSIRKFIIFQLTMNLCALTLSIFGPFLGINTPITVMQMLWINMIMDTLAGLAFSFEAPQKRYMNEQPLKRSESIINKYMYSSILITGVYTAILLILFLKLPFIKSIYRVSVDDKYMMTAFFGLFVFSGVMNAFNARTSRINIFSNITHNKPFIFIIMFIVIIQVILLYKGGITFRTYGLNIKEFLVMMALSLSVIPVDIMRKMILKNSSV